MVTYSNRGLHGQLVESLGVQIVQGTIAPGEIIDVEQLGADRDVSRTVVREAVKVLVGKGLLDARPKYGTFVRERAEWNLLDPDVIRWRQLAGPDPRLLRELEEIRMILEPLTARLAAHRLDQGHLDDLATALQGLGDVDSHVEADLLFHRTIAAATGNELLERVTRMLEPAQRTRDELIRRTAPVDGAYLDAHRIVYEALTRRDPDDAEAAMRALIESASRDTEVAIRPQPKAE